MPATTNTGLWSQADVPHRGWHCVGVEDIRPDGQPEDETEYATCQMCGNERIRFVHMMEHPEFDRVVEAGCVCAEKMSGDYVNPRLQEGRLRKKASRKARWLRRKWRTSHKGNHYLNVDGMNLVVFPAKFKPGRWCFRVDGDFSRSTYASHDEAKLALFEEFWERLSD
ncbi:MAG: hypothetical protein JNM43_18305 [Planctomycetaceae bacterium]|nr:hypothetical protein [Planctomycetaceae bacterium]